MILQYLVSAFLVIGGFFMVVGAFGLARLPDFFMRLHGPTKATTLGVGSFLIAAMLFFISTGEGVPSALRAHRGVSLPDGAVSAHLLSRAGMSEGLPGSPGGGAEDETEAG